MQTRKGKKKKDNIYVDPGRRGSTPSNSYPQTHIQTHKRMRLFFSVSHKIDISEFWKLKWTAGCPDLSIFLYGVCINYERKTVQLEAIPCPRQEKQSCWLVRRWPWLQPPNQMLHCNSKWHPSLQNSESLRYLCQIEEDCLQPISKQEYRHSPHLHH